MEARIVIPGCKNGIDVSSSNGTINFKKVKEAGFDFVYVQSSRYSKQKDAGFQDKLDRARNAGLVVGAYHFCAHDTDPARQADFFFQACLGLGSQPGALPPMMDWEYCTPSKYKNHPRHCVEWIEVFSDHVRANFGQDGVIYTYPNYAATHQPSLSESLVLWELPVCLASYPNRNGYVPKSVEEVPFHPTPTGLASPVLVQYSGDKGAPVPGVSGACDRQVFLGTDEEWLRFIGMCPNAT